MQSLENSAFLSLSVFILFVIERRRYLTGLYRKLDFGGVLRE